MTKSTARKPIQNATDPAEASSSLGWLETFPKIKTNETVGKEEENRALEQKFAKKYLKEHNYTHDGGEHTSAEELGRLRRKLNPKEILKHDFDKAVDEDNLPAFFAANPEVARQAQTVWAIRDQQSPEEAASQLRSVWVPTKELSPEVAEARRAIERKKKKNQRDNETPAQAAERRARHAAYMAAKRAGLKTSL